jgi:disulfide bond formation protein DsbB
MKKSLLAAGLAAWIGVGTVLLSRWWYANPDFFPRFPDSLWQWMDTLFGASNVDEASNVEMMGVVFVALIMVSVATALVAALYARIKRKN